MKKMGKQLFNILLCVLVVFTLFPSQVFAWDETETCEYCGRFIGDSWICDCGPHCSSEADGCYSQHHCSECGEAFEQICEECGECSECGADDHCSECGECYDTDPDSLCHICKKCESCGEECESGWDVCHLCIECHGEAEMSCPTCGKCLVGTAEEDICGKCNQCSDCGEVCNFMYLCNECGIEEGTHCQECGLCLAIAEDFCMGCKVCSDCSTKCKECSANCTSCSKLCENCNTCEDCAEICPECDSACSGCSTLCANCGVCSECATPCSECGDFCDGCAALCGDCGKCENCATICPECGDSCSECAKVCEGCGVCEDCAKICEICEAHCSSCDSMCENCERACSQCIPQCEYCGFCEECATICEECNQNCSNCSNLCENCQTCEDCAIICEDCGLYCNSCTAMCEDCSKCEKCVDLCPECEAHCSDCNQVCKNCGRCENCETICPSQYDHCSGCAEVCGGCGFCEYCADICPECKMYCSSDLYVCGGCKRCETCEDLCDFCEDKCSGCDTICEHCGGCESCCEKASKAAGCEHGVCINSPNWDSHWEEQHEDEAHHHNYLDTWMKDETTHWHPCNVGTSCSSKGSEEAHEFEWIIDKVATETETGSKHQLCKVCHYETAPVEIPTTAPGHVHSKDGTGIHKNSMYHWYLCECGARLDKSSHERIWKIDKMPTTTEEGSKHTECTVCGYKDAPVTINKLGVEHTHDYGSAWKTDTDQHWHECSCGSVKDQELHSFVWIIDKVATETDPGSKHEECAICGFEKSPVEIPATGPGHVHNYGTEWGIGADQHWHQCSCGMIQDAENHIFLWKTDQQPTAFLPGSKHEECSVCGYAKPAVEIPAIGPIHIHNYGTEWQMGADQHWHQCSCGMIQDREDHIFLWKTDKEPTDSAPGSKHEECSVCGYAKPAVEIPMKHSHHYGKEWKKNTTSHWHECSCGEKSDVALHIDVDGDNKCDFCGTKMATETSSYIFKKGMNLVWHKGSGTSLEFITNGEFVKFLGIKVDGDRVDKNKYTAVSGSTIITLKPEYLETLSVGSHVLTALYTDGEVRTNFQVVGLGAEDPAPKTGENGHNFIWITLLLLSLGGILANLVYGKKKISQK